LERVTVNINPDNVNIKLSGSSAVIKIASIFIPLIKSTILPQIVNQMEDQIKTIVSTTIDTDLADFGTHVTFPDLAGASLDYAQLNGGPRIKNKVFTMDLNGTFFNAEKPAATKYAPYEFDSSDLKGK
jgi:hypothetical protein